MKKNNNIADSVNSETLNNYINGIRKTGYVLEHRVGRILKKHKWNVISNKYYEDDRSGEVKEIDLLAYKASKPDNMPFQIYTAVLISCKKSESNVWAMLCRDVDKKSPNTNWRPLHIWTNVSELNFQQKVENENDGYQDFISKNEDTTLFDVPDIDIFAFQELNKTSGNPGNDRPIYDSVVSTIKAQSYEINALQNRIKKDVVYQFNLLTVLDTKLYAINLDTQAHEPESRSYVDYIIRYIVQKKETDSRIRFVTADSFESVLEEYNKLHQLNVKWFSQQYNDFYIEPLANTKKISLLLCKFQDELVKELKGHIKSRYGTNIEIYAISLFFNDKKNYATVDFDDEKIDPDDLRNDLEIHKVVKRKLKDIYKYEGNFILDNICFGF